MNISIFEPLLPPEGDAQLEELAVRLVARSNQLAGQLHPHVRASIGDLVRSMNCYYSNLIEGHNTHPIDIERALKGDYNKDSKKRDLQLEAKAHITVQEWIDGGGLKGRALTGDGIREIHQRFCELLPEDLLWVEDPETKERAKVVPGELRRKDAVVGRHVAVSPGAIPRFLARFEEVYSHLNRTDAILGAAAAHHRLAWIHPFLDGNGRVARLMSHAMLLETLDTGAVWSVARGLARNVDVYKNHLADCDSPRRNDLDGRGTLSEEALARFANFFLSMCIDQVTFMEGLMQPEKLRTRILSWAEEEIKLGALPAKSGNILEAILYRGELPRAAAAAAVGATDRHARRIVSALTEHGVLTAAGPRAPLRLVFPATLASRWMPGLFPERDSPAARRGLALPAPDAK